VVHARPVVIRFVDALRHATLRVRRVQTLCRSTGLENAALCGYRGHDRVSFEREVLPECIAQHVGREGRDAFRASQDLGSVRADALCMFAIQ
jgi:hypothetical protein